MMRFAFLAAVIALCLSAFVHLAFLDRELGYDETHLSNAAYTFQRYGRTTFPVHGEYDYIAVHPPTHYMVIGALMRAGLPLAYAAAFEPCLLLLIIAWLLLRSAFPDPVRYGLLCGVFLAAFVWNALYTVRPDIAWSLAWMAGLLALESARLDDWDRRRLVLGALLLAWAAATHYPAAPAPAALAVYAVWAWLRLPHRQALGHVALIAGAAGLVLAPYIFLQVLPSLPEIRHTLLVNQGPGDWLTAIRRHLDIYAIWCAGYASMFTFQPLVESMLLPLWWLRLPAAVAGPLLLALFPTTRVLALAAAPEVLFIAFGSRYKQLGYPGYLVPEAILWIAGVVAILFTGVDALARRTGWKPLPAVALGLFTLLVLHDKPRTAGPHPRFVRVPHAERDLARAAAREVLGPHALVGYSAPGMWYTSGAADLVALQPETDYTAAALAPGFFSSFDAVLTQGATSWITHNQPRVTLTTLYSDRRLHLRGFWFGDPHDKSESSLSYQFYAAAPVPLHGYAARDGRVWRFDEDPAGDTVLYAAVCPQPDLARVSRPAFLASSYLPDPSGTDPTGVAGKPAIRTVLAPRSVFSAEVEPQTARCRERDRRMGRITEVDPSALVGALRAGDRPIRFLSGTAIALGASHGLRARSVQPVPVQPGPAYPARNDVTVTAAGAGVVRIVISAGEMAGPGSVAVTVPLVFPDPEGGGYLEVQGTVVKGSVSLAVMGDALATNAVWRAADTIDCGYFPVPSFAAINRLVISSGRTGRSAEMLLRAIKAVRRR